MNGNTATLTLGSLPFSASANDLRTEAERILERAQNRIDEILGSGGARTIANTLEPVDRVLLQVFDVGSHGRFMFSVHPSAAIRDAGRDAAEASDRFYNRFRLNQAAYQALGAVDVGSADEATRHALDRMLREMRRAGVELGGDTRERLRSLNDEIDRISNEFAENIAKLVRTVEVDHEHELDGLPDDYRAAHRPDSSGRIRITTQYPDIIPVLAYARNADLRRRSLHEFLNRAYPENLPVLDSLLAKRYELARLLGYPNYAAYVMEDKMMRSPEKGQQFLDRVAGTIRARAHADLDLFLRRKQVDHPGARNLEPWDAAIWSWEGYYDAKVRAEQFGVDTKVLRQYLPYAQVRDGLFHLCERLFGLRFDRVRLTDLWHPTVEAYDVHQGSQPLGRFYLDLVPRDGKYGHAAQFDVRTGIRDVQLPQAALACNFMDPNTPPENARLQYSDVVTFFHEFGHLLHALFSGHGRWLYNGQSFVEWDFIEAPSQLFEEWARDPATLSEFARNPDTGESVPAELLERLKASESVGRASRWLIQVAYAAISLDLYNRDPTGVDSTELLRRVYDRYAILPAPEDAHFQAAWGHLTGYSAIYYTYTWSLVIARDLLSPFREKGSLTDPGLARRYAEEILIPGGSRPASELIRRYLGREFDFRAFDDWVLSEPTARPGVRAAPEPARPQVED